MITNAAKIVSQVRAQAPLIQCITNYVTVNDCANILLAYGASPAMVEARVEAGDFARISGAVYLNLGTLTREQEDAMLEAVKGAAGTGIPVVLDPAGCGAVPHKREVLDRLAEAGRLSLIKGNAGEILVLAGMDAQVKGVDSGDASLEVTAEAVARLAKAYGCVVSATGPVDLAGDGQRLVRVENGVPLLTKITGAGCMLGALCAATAAVSDGDILSAAVAALLSMGIAGELAHGQAKGPGSFRVALMDSVYTLDEAAIVERGRVQC